MPSPAPLNIPGLRFFFVLAFALLASGMAIHTAMEQPRWATPFVEGDILRGAHSAVTLTALDFTPEPGEIIDDALLLNFYLRQQRLSEILATQAITLETADGIRPLHRQDTLLTRLPLLFWIQITVGLGALIIAGWVWALRARDLAASLFAVSGLSTLLFTFSAAIYTTRDLALPAVLFRMLAAVNVFGASLFGIAMVALFLIYPVRLKRWRSLMVAQAIFFSFWTGLSLAGQLPAWAGVNLITLTEMVVIILVLGAQFLASRGKPAERASLSWLGLSVLAGAGGFIALNALPLVITANAAVEQGYAFLFFLVIYLGLAAGITRYRLFDVGNWAFAFLFYSLGAFLLLLMDAALIYLAGLERVPALGLSFFAIGLLYLPMRDRLQRRFRNVPALQPHVLIDGAMQVALAPTPTERHTNWTSLLQRLFAPLAISPLPAEGTSHVQLGDNGLSLFLPSVADTPAVCLSYPQRGKALFSRQSADLAKNLIALVERAVSSRDAYEKGAREERTRIAQDLHDDIGARLLDGLHADEQDLRTIIQATMADIASIVKGISGEKMPLAETLADIRSESLIRLDTAGIDTHWPIEPYEHTLLRVGYPVHKALTSILREAVSNVIRHANANSLQVRLLLADNMLQASVQDNGSGFPAVVLHGETGFGLTGMTKRVHALNGTLNISNTSQGARLDIRIPLPQGISE